MVLRLVLSASLATGTWSGSTAQEVDEGDLGQNVSGLVFSTDASVLWAVRDDPGALLRLVADEDGEYVIEHGWGDGRDVHWPDGDGRPDAEAVTVAEDRGDVVYVAAERDNEHSGTSRPSVLEVPVGDADGDLVASRSWDLTALLPEAEANSGIEGIAWVPDDVLVAGGFVEGDGVVYDPAAYADHGSGVFVVGSEGDGALDVFVLGDEATHLATVDSGLPSVMEVAFDAASGEVWAACDDHCDGRIERLGLRDGSFATIGTIEPPEALSSLDDEGLAIGPCTGGTRTVVWSDDAASDDHALRAATAPCPSAVADSSATGDAGEERSWIGIGSIVGVLAAVGVGLVVAFRRPRAR